VNSIKAELTITEYVNGEHLMIFIDGIRFDKWLSNKLTNEDYLNLIPTWLGWLLNPKEQEYVWAKIRLCETEKVILPILVCPDDLDFSCTVIVCEVQYMDDAVQWKRIGIDKTNFPNYIGEVIEWFQKVPLLEFSRQQYEACIDKFISSKDK
jgi:hypothetical protein